jgi:hypothetical protein
MRVVRMLASAVIGMTGVLCGACATSDRAWTASDTALAAAEEAGHSWVTMGSAADVREESVLVMKGSPGIPFEPIGPLYARRRGLQLLWRISVIDTDLDHVVREVLIPMAKKLEADAVTQLSVRYSDSPSFISSILTLGTVVWTVEVDGLAVRLPGRLRDRDALPGPGPREEPSLVEPRGERPSAK